MKVLTLFAAFCALGLGCNAIIGLDSGAPIAGAGGSYGDAGPDSRLGDAGLDGTYGDAGLDGSFGDAGLDGTDGDAGGPGPTLPPVAPGHLQLWLTADEGLLCDDASGRVIVWHDQSGHGRDTSTAHGQKPPRCGAHTLNGVDVPFFDAPTPQNGTFVDGTLDVDLSFLTGSDFTIFVVERRWADRSGVSVSNMFLGTTLPDEHLTCSSGAQLSALQEGYVYYDGYPAIDMDLTCAGCRVEITPVPATPPAAAAIDTSLFSSAVGQALWVNGEKVASTGATSALTAASGGAVGRGPYVYVEETRYIGDIAEVIAFDSALDAADRAAIEAYLAMHWAQAFTPP